MRQRCTNPKKASYRYYGARGIKVCPEWNEFSVFLADMGEPPEGKSLDRFPDNDGDYCKANCRWATLEEQAATTRRASYIEVNGVRRRVRDLEVELGLSQGTIWHRLKKGWPIEKACTTPRIES
jgi:hypothetical protein